MEPKDEQKHQEEPKEQEHKEEKKEHKEPQKNEEPGITVSSRGVILAVIIIIGALVVFFGLRFFFTQGPDYPVVQYNEFEFQQIDNLWYTHLQKGDQVYTVSLRFNPFDVENVSVSGSNLDKPLTVFSQSLPSSSSNTPSTWLFTRPSSVV